jgi:hypothetical protein
VRAERILGRAGPPQLVLLGQRQPRDLREPDRRVGTAQLPAVERGALEQVVELAAETRVVER